MVLDKEAHLYRRRRFLLLLVVALAFALIVLFEYSAEQQLAKELHHQDIAIEEINQDESLVLAVEVLGELAVQEQVSRDGYERSKFSPGWARVAGCDIRNRILQRDLSNVVLDEDNCLVLSGVLEVDPFTSESIDFIRGPDTSSDIHIEHLVAVSDAWMKGAQDLSYQRRHQFYNDPLNLVAVDGIANIVKGDKDAADWLPQQEYRCLYIARQIAVKLKYDLWVRDEEYVAMRQVLNTCPAQILPIESPVG